jgi:hypothetical protein
VPITQEDEGFAAESQFVFKGTVEKVNASTMPTVRASEQTAIVRVDDVLQAPPVMAAFTGSSITVQVGPDQRLAEGQRAVFFTNGWQYGRDLAVTAVSVRPAGAEDMAESPTAPDDAVARFADREVRERVAGADLIVVGRVASVRPRPESPAEPRVLTEHEPQWHEADVQVESVEKGGPPDTTVTVDFPRSTDVAWYQAPKFSEGDEGVWLLRHKEAEPTRVVYTALHPLDFHPKDALPMIRRHVASLG